MDEPRYAQILGSGSIGKLDTTLIQIVEKILCSLSVDDGFDQVSKDTVVSITEEPMFLLLQRQSFPIQMESK